MPETNRFGGRIDHHAEFINPTLHVAREEDLVGIKDNVEKLTEWLLEEKNTRIITVWGMGGAGKTTLVDHVYKTIKEKFDFAAWVTVSKSYQIEDLLKKIARHCGTSVDVSNMDFRSLVEAIRNNLHGKRYILVLDDVWENDVWMKLMDVFPSNSISCFIITSRNSQVSSLATDNCSIMLQPLEDGLSWKLFCNVAFRNKDDKRCPLDLHDLATKFIKQCEGLPLAIACMGRLLSCKPPTYSAWKNVYKELELQSSKHVIPGVESVLKVSLDDLTYELKNCFLHCALFPEDYEIKRRRLIRQWITSGFIKEKGNKILEEVTEGYLNELVNRSLLQVTKKNVFGRVKCCQMHDIIRHLAIDKADEQCFGKVYEGSKFSKACLRRLSIQSTHILPLHHSDITHLYQMFNLFNLRFLSIRHTKIEIIPDGIRRLQNLEVLHACNTCLVSLPKGVAELKKLRYLYASIKVIINSVVLDVGVNMPRGIGNLTGLHAMQKVKASLETLRDVAALTELRTFSVSDVTSKHCSTLCTTIMNMSHLVHLSISASDQNEILPLEALRFPETLYKLELCGQLKKKWMSQFLSNWSHLSNLAYLSLAWSKFDDYSFSRFLNLRSLCLLRMNEAYDGKTLHFPVHSFPKLRELHIIGAPHLNQVEIEEGALQSLGILKFGNCPELKYLPRGIEYLTALEELHLLDTSEELIEKLMQKSDADECNEELMKICHIRSVYVVLKGFNLVFIMVK